MDEKFNPPPCGGMNGTTTGYLVEARYQCPNPKQFGDIILDKEWRTLHFQNSPIGVPGHGARWDGGLQRESLGLLSYPAAEALRWWFIAGLDAESVMSYLLVETRIVAHKIKYSLSAEPFKVISVVEGINVMGVEAPKESAAMSAAEGVEKS